MRLLGFEKGNAGSKSSRASNRSQTFTQAAEPVEYNSPSDQDLSRRKRPSRSAKLVRFPYQGFGSGEHLVSQAKAHPEIGFIGCEPYINGIVKVLSSIEEGNIGNIRIYDDDAVHVISRLSPKSVDRVFLLFPDPWPKKRHAKRRFVTRENADHLANIMKDGGELRIASDIGAYVRSTLLTFADHKAFAWVDDGPHSWNIRTPDWPPTRYEQKALRADRKPVYLRFLKR